MLKKKALPLEEALARHRAAVVAFLASAAMTESQVWTTESAAGKWSPAQVAEHLLLALQAIQAEVEHGSPIRMVLPAWKRFLLRRAVLPRLLATGRFPAGARAPREIRPSVPTTSKEEALRRLEGAAAEFEAACRQSPRLEKRRLGHPYFGALPATDLIRILAWHTLHHRAQLPGEENRSHR